MNFVELLQAIIDTILTVLLNGLREQYAAVFDLIDTIQLFTM